MEKINLSYKILALVAALSFVAIAPLPYGFYTFVRITVCGCAGVICYQLWNADYRGAWLWLWGMVAVLYNPVAKIHMSKELWMAANVLAGALFAIAAYKAYLLGKRRNQESMTAKEGK